MSNKIYHTRKNMPWTDVKKAMSRVKKFRKKGFYLEVEEQPAWEYEVRSVIAPERWPKKVKAGAHYTTRLWGPVKP